LPAAFRDQAPSFKDAYASRGGRPPLRLEGQRASDLKRAAESKQLKYVDRVGGRDPTERLKAMAMDGVVGEVLYPTLGGRLFYLEDAELQQACFQVYNDWLVEYCGAVPSRLFGIAAISTYDIDRAIKEITRCKNAGLRGAMIWQYPPKELPFTSNHYDRFWTAAQDLQMPVSLHISTGHGSSKGFRNERGMESYRRTINGRTQEIMDALFEIVFSGVLERFPRLQLVLVENEVGWIPFWLQQCDRYFERYRFIDPLPMKNLPSEYFCRQVYATFFNDEVGGRNLSWWGVDNCMWSSDYPHSNTTWPHSREVIARDLGHLPPAARSKLVSGNVARLYNLDIAGL
jgi:predicted TIM-barrel fold metal-dependent hydrolase